MSIVAFDGVILAADRASWKGDVWSHTKKLFQVAPCDECVCRFRLPAITKNLVWGACGMAAEVPLMLRWMQKGGDVPSLEDKDMSRGLILDAETGEVYGLTGLLTLEPFTHPPVADGGGHQLALGAMLAGASAIRAVELVAARTAMAAGGVDFYTLRALEATAGKRGFPPGNEELT